MKKILLVIGLAVISAALIIGGIILFVQNGKEISQEAIETNPHLAYAIAMFFGGVGVGITTLASFLTSKVKVKTKND